MSAPRLRAPRRSAFPSAALALVMLSASPGLALGQETETIDPDPQAVAAVNTLMDGLATEDEAARWSTVATVLHAVLLTPDGSDVHPNFKRILGRTVRTVGDFIRPVEIDRVERVHAAEGRPHRFGSLEVEVVDRYYVKKSDGSSSFVGVVWVEGVPKVVAVP